MAATLRIKRSLVSGNPATLASGELAYSGLADNGSNGGDRLYIGMGTETNGNAANHVIIGGKYFTDMLDHNKGTLTAGSALIVDANKKLDELLVDNLSLNGNTLSTTDTNGNLILTPNGTGKVSIAGAYTLPRVDGSAGYLLTTDGSGNVSWQASGIPTFTVTTASVGLSSLSYNNGVFTFTPPDLSSYATQSYVTSQGYQTASNVNTLIASSLTNYATQSYVTSQGYQTAGDVSTALSGYATQLYVTSQGYITSSALNNYATESFVTSQGYITSSALNNYATESFVTSQGYITGSALNGYATESFVTSQGYITSSALNNYATESFVTSQGYITSSALNGYATEVFVNNKGYITTASVNALIANSLTNYATQSYVTSQGYQTALDVNTLIASSLTNYATESYVTSRGYITSSALSGYTTTATVNSLIANSLTNYATQSYVDTKGYATTATVNSLIANSLTNYATESYVTSQGYITSSALSGYATESYVTTQGYITTASLSVTTLAASTSTNSLTYNNGVFNFTPIDVSGFATQSYVQAVAQGLHIHAPVDVATTATLASITGGSVTYDNGISGVGATLTLGTALTVLDGYTLQDGDRILVKNQANQAHNGVYTWATGGTVLTRSLYEDEVSQFGGGDFFFVTHGTINGDTGWVQTEALATFGSSNIIFQQFAGAGTYQVGAGLSQSGNIFSISTTYAGQSSITTLGTISAGTWNADTISAAKGGTGITSYGAYDLLVGTIAGGLTKLPMGLAGQFLQVNSAGDGLVYADIDGGTY